MQRSKVQWTVELNVRCVEETQLLSLLVPPVQLLYHHLVPAHGGNVEGRLPHLIPDSNVRVLV